MRDASVALVAYLLSRAPVIVADLFTFALTNGTTLRWTTFDKDIIWAGETWRTGGPLIARSALSVKHTAEIPELSMTLGIGPDADQEGNPNPQNLVNGINLKRAIMEGVFTGAFVEMDRAFMPEPGDVSLGPVIMFTGRMSTATVTAIGGELVAKGANVLMNQKAPRNTYDLGCLHTFCDAGCTLSEAAFTLTTTVGSSPPPTNRLIPWASVPGDPSLYNLGKITMTSGTLAGQQRSVKNATNTGIEVTHPFAEIPLAGDGMGVLQGCNRTITRCVVLANQQHFRGFKFIPTADNAV